MFTENEWINGKFEETETDYKISGKNILWKNEIEFLPKGVELLCKKLKPKSVLEFGFGLGWTATEFQKHNIERHIIIEPNKDIYQMALEWKKQYNTDIEILNLFSWDFKTDENFDLVYDDREPIASGDTEKHFKHIKTILPKKQLYAFNSYIAKGDNFGQSIEYTLNGIKYRQSLTEGFYGNN